LSDVAAARCAISATGLPGDHIAASWKAVSRTGPNLHMAKDPIAAAAPRR